MKQIAKLHEKFWWISNSHICNVRCIWVKNNILYNYKNIFNQHDAFPITPIWVEKVLLYQVNNFSNTIPCRNNIDVNHTFRMRMSWKYCILWKTYFIAIQCVTWQQCSDKSYQRAQQRPPLFSAFPHHARMDIKGRTKSRERAVRPEMRAGWHRSVALDGRPEDAFSDGYSHRKVSPTPSNFLVKPGRALANGCSHGQLSVRPSA